jgi:hypothetical protein
VLNSPLKFTDPTGHVFCDEFGTCHDHGETYQGENTYFYSESGGDSGGSGGGNDEVVDNSTVITNSSVIDSGTVYATIAVILAADANDRNLSSRAEDNYTDFGPFYGDVTKWWTWVSDALSVYEDFNTSLPPTYPIYIGLDWQLDSDWYALTGVEVTNYSPTFVKVSEVSIASAKETIKTSSEHVASQGERININLFYRIDPWLTTTVVVRLRNPGGLFVRPYVTFNIPIAGKPEQASGFPVCTYP